MNCTALKVTVVWYFLKKDVYGADEVQEFQDILHLLLFDKVKGICDEWYMVGLKHGKDKPEWKFWFEKYCFYKIYIRGKIKVNIL